MSDMPRILSVKLQSDFEIPGSTPRMRRKTWRVRSDGPIDADIAMSAIRRRRRIPPPSETIASAATSMSQIIRKSTMIDRCLYEVVIYYARQTDAERALTALGH